MSTSVELAGASPPVAADAHPVVAHVGNNNAIPVITAKSAPAQLPADLESPTPVGNGTMSDERVGYSGAIEGNYSHPNDVHTSSSPHVLTSTSTPMTMDMFEKLPTEYVQRYVSDPVGCCRNQCLRHLFEDKPERFVYYWYKAGECNKNGDRQLDKRDLVHEFREEMKEPCSVAEGKLLGGSPERRPKEAMPAMPMPRRKNPRSLLEYDELVRMDCCKKRCLSRLSYPQFCSCREKFVNGDPFYKEEVLRYLLWNAYECDLYPWCIKGLSMFLGAADALIASVRSSLRESRDGTLGRSRKRPASLMHPDDNMSTKMARVLSPGAAPGGPDSGHVPSAMPASLSLSSVPPYLPLSYHGGASSSTPPPHHHPH
eukprot:Rmarinus@m.10362